MNLPLQLHQEVEKWANNQGISSEQFILWAVAEKVSALNQQTAQATAAAKDLEVVNTPAPQPPRVYRKEGILVVETEPISNLDINNFIGELREERIRDQMSW